MLTGRLRAVERSRARSSVETAEVAARKCHPRHALAIDVHPARRKTLDRLTRIVQRQLVNLRKRRLGRIRPRIQANHGAGIAQRRTPYGAVGGG